MPKQNLGPSKLPPNTSHTKFDKFCYINKSYLLYISIVLPTLTQFRSLYSTLLLLSNVMIIILIMILEMQGRNTTCVWEKNMMKSTVLYPYDLLHLSDIINFQK